MGGDHRGPLSWDGSSRRVLTDPDCRTSRSYPMARIAAVGTAVPPHGVTQEAVQAFSRDHFAGALDELPRLLPVFEHAAIARRYFSMPPDWFAHAPSFAERNAHFVEAATTLAAATAEQCLERAGRDPAEIGTVLVVSTTGLATPSIDAYLIQRLGLSPHTRRLPLWGLGCAGGVVGLARAADLARAAPESFVLLVAVELCALTFCPEDRSKSNFIATALFGDGAGAVLVAGPGTGASGPRIVGAHSTLWPGTDDVMGWDVAEDGFRVRFSKDIPTFVRRHLSPAVEQFLKPYGLGPADVAHHVVHPGGPRVLGAYAEALGIPDDRLAIPRAVLCEYGNMSSASVLFVLDRTLSEGHARTGDYGLLLALGPGFSAEQLLIRWEEAE
ncbi:MAG: type III polyketide synthase [Candidatus Tectimicrobiota bacterium]